MKWFKVLGALIVVTLLASPIVVCIYNAGVKDTRALYKPELHTMDNQLAYIQGQIDLCGPVLKKLAEDDKVFFINGTK